MSGAFDTDAIKNVFSFNGGSFIFCHTVLSIISVEQEMTDHYYVELLDGVYNGQIKKIVLHPRYEANRSVNGNHINIIT